MKKFFVAYIPVFFTCLGIILPIIMCTIYNVTILITLLFIEMICIAVNLITLHRMRYSETSKYGGFWKSIFRNE